MKGEYRNSIENALVDIGAGDDIQENIEIIKDVLGSIESDISDIVYNLSVESISDLSHLEDAENLAKDLSDKLY